MINAITDAIGTEDIAMPATRRDGVGGDPQKAAKLQQAAE